jgi:hypothetical protein
MAARTALQLRVPEFNYSTQVRCQLGGCGVSFGCATQSALAVCAVESNCCGCSNRCPRLRPEVLTLPQVRHQLEVIESSTATEVRKPFEVVERFVGSCFTCRPTRAAQPLQARCQLGGDQLLPPGSEFAVCGCGSRFVKWLFPPGALQLL